MGALRSQPTAMDIRPDGHLALVLTDKHAYLFARPPGETWAAAFAGTPRTVDLPLSDTVRDLRQREAVGFGRRGDVRCVTSEGRHAGVYLLDAAAVAAAGRR